MPTLITVVLQAWGLTTLLMLFFWLIAVRTKNAGWVDVGWTLGLVACIWFYALWMDGSALRHYLLVGAVSLWALRLVYHMLARFIAEGHEDKRYQKIREDWKTDINLKLLFFFQFQAFLDVVLSLCWVPSMRNAAPGLHLLEIAGILLWIIGFFGESIADGQLKAFKADAANRGKTCQRGLWNYSRHPNYFFEWLMWVAYAVFAFASAWGWVSLIAVALMYHFLMNVSGVPLAEAQSLKSRGEEYRRYQQTTSMFVPWFKRKGAL